LYLNGNWENRQKVEGKSYTCGHCGVKTSSNGGYKNIGRNIHTDSPENKAYIYICASCNYPTLVQSKKDYQVPHPKVADDVKNLPPVLESLFKEVREALSAGLYNSSVLLGRKMLMNIAVEEGAEESKSYAHYVSYLESNGLITNSMKPWVDQIRKIGNTATHEVPDVKKDDAYMSFEFLTMMLKLVY